MADWDEPEDYSPSPRERLERQAMVEAIAKYVASMGYKPLAKAIRQKWRDGHDSAAR